MTDARRISIDRADVPFLDVAPAFRGGWVVTLRGEQITGIYPCKSLAQTGFDRIVAATRRQRRECITCGTSFNSDGPHNRMCRRCRSDGQALSAQWEAF